MRLQEEHPTLGGEPRYDAETLRKVAALATRLQGEQQDTLSAAEIEAAGAEVGLEPAFIRRALAQVGTDPPKVTAPVVKAPVARVAVAKKPMVGWKSTVATLGTPVYVAALAAVLGDGITNVVAMPGLLPLAFLLGLLSGRKGMGMLAAAELVLFMTVLLNNQFIYTGRSPIAYFLIALPLAMGTAWLGANARERRTPPAATLPDETSRIALLESLFSLQHRLEAGKTRCAFLSVDVVGSFEMKQGASDLTAEYSFGQFRLWVEGVVRDCGGELQSAAGDGIMCLFRTDSGALRAARRLQEGLARFNAEQNRLQHPFRIRCGVNAGPVALEAGMPLGYLHSPVIDRAAALQKRAEPGDILVSEEVAPAALMELGSLARLPEAVAGGTVFSWRAGQGITPAL